jgi:flagellar hook-length control protein FliK
MPKLDQPTQVSPQQSESLQAEDVLSTEPILVAIQEPQVKPHGKQQAEPSKVDPAKAIETVSTVVATETAEVVKAVENMSTAEGVTVEKKPSKAMSSKAEDERNPQVFTESLREAAPAPVTKSETLSREKVEHVLRQVQDRIEFLAAAKPKGGVTIHLEPRELGTVTLHVTSRGNEVEAKIDASVPAVRDALNESRHDVARAMESRGMQLNVSVGSDQGSKWHQAKPQASPRLTVPAGHDQDIDVVDVRVARRSGRDVDLWI